jgi:hypothetical protein
MERNKESLEKAIANAKYWREWYLENGDLVAVWKYNESIAEMESELKKGEN